MTMTQLEEIADVFLKIWETKSLPSGCVIDIGALSLDEFM